MRVDVAGDPRNPDLKIAWKFLYTAKDTWLGASQNIAASAGGLHLTMDPYEKYDMLFNGAVQCGKCRNSPGQYGRARTTAGLWL